MKEVKNRKNYLDIAKGMAIILVIIGHNIDDGIIKQTIYSFHMPLFFIVSGYFIKRPEISKGDIKKWNKTLLLPYFLTAFFTVIVSFLLRVNGIANSLSDDLLGLFTVGFTFGSYSVPYIGAIWFLISLYLAKLLFGLYRTFTYGHQLELLLAFAAIILFRRTQTILPFCTMSACVNVLFLEVGYFIRKNGILEITINNSLVIIGSLLIFAFAHKVSVSSRILIYNLGILNIITSSIISVCFIFLCKYSEKLFSYSENINRLILFCGRNSLAILCIHSVEAHLHLLDFISVPQFLSVIIKIVITILLAYLLYLNKYTKFVFNMK